VIDHQKAKYSNEPLNLQAQVIHRPGSFQSYG